MGCCSAKNDAAQAPVPTQRRRLSVGQVEGAAQYTEVEISDEDRGIILSMDQTNILELIEMPDDDRKFSIGSETDKELAKKASFAEKKVHNIGSPVDPNKSGIGFACRKGLKPETANQDSWSVLKLGDYSIYGVFDGHGKMGHHVSNFVKESLPKLIVKDQRFKTTEMCEMLTDIYKRMQNMIATATRLNKFDALMSGCTTTVLIHDHLEKKLYVSWVGDSGAMVVKKPPPNQGDQKWNGQKLTWDHKPDEKGERSRIEKTGGRVVFDGYANHRVYAKQGRYPGLNMSRALGDLMGHRDAGISAEPTTCVYDLVDDDKMIVLCSDGVWEFISHPEVAAIVGAFPSAKAMAAADKLAKESWERWIREEGGMVVDDITAVIIYLQEPKA
mmetsp:Transcript_10199/g.16563  ORF Transcript_10199/g.16563 Transcript_10199/m.16563 type:complete len:387 (+) Transcript_10199:118-1278(+)